MSFSKELEPKDGTGRSECHFHYTVYKELRWPLIHIDRRKAMHALAKASAETMKNEEAEDPIK